jgi:hypothetical protein
MPWRRQPWPQRSQSPSATCILTCTRTRTNAHTHTHAHTNTHTHAHAHAHALKHAHAHPPHAGGTPPRLRVIPAGARAAVHRPAARRAAAASPPAEPPVEARLHVRDPPQRSADDLGVAAADRPPPPLGKQAGRVAAAVTWSAHAVMPRRPFNGGARLRRRRRTTRSPGMRPWRENETSASPAAQSR